MKQQTHMIVERPVVAEHAKPLDAQRDDRVQSLDQRFRLQKLATSPSGRDRHRFLDLEHRIVFVIANGNPNRGEVDPGALHEDPAGHALEIEAEGGLVHGAGRLNRSLELVAILLPLVLGHLEDLAGEALVVGAAAEIVGDAVELFLAPVAVLSL